MTASSSIEGKRTDQNGEGAALIKVNTAEQGFVFEGGTLGIIDTKQKVGEIWVWVPRGLRKITILHQELGILRDYRFPVDIESERTYEMVLVTGKVETSIKPVLRQQYLAFQITPPNATLEVDDTPWEVGSDGTAMRFVNFGTYSYRVQAPDYHPDAGKITVNDPNNTQKVFVDLKPNFGWIEVSGEGLLEGASVYIDNAFVGKAPCKSEPISSGQHLIRIVKERYEPYSQVVTVKDTEVTSIAPSLNAGFAEVTLQVDADAEIWVNNERKGVRSWTGTLGNGTYWIECRQENHDPTVRTQEITAAMNGQVINLELPHPIYGSLNVESTPAFASIFIDGVPMGETPKFVSELLVGQHELRLTKDGFAARTETVTIVKGERTQFQATLSKAGDGQTQKPGKQEKKEKQVKEKKDKSAKEPKQSAAVQMPGKTFALVNLSVPNLSFGVSFGTVKRFGWFVSAMTNASFKGFSATECDMNGYLSDGSLPLYTGKSAVDRLSLMAGGVMRLSKSMCVKVGLGYGVRNLNWQTINGDYFKNSPYSYSGIDVSGGVQMSFGKFVVSLEAVSTSFKTVEGKFGLGLEF